MAGGQRAPPSTSVLRDDSDVPYNARMIQLRRVEVRPSAKLDPESYPGSVPFVQARADLELTTPVTFLVGENGSGKSTWMESVAYAAQMIVAGSDDVATDDTLAHVRSLGHALRLTWGKRTHKGFFLRAEDYFGFVRRLANLRAGLQRDLDETETEFKDKSDWARGLATGHQKAQIRETFERYGGHLDARSHGESFLTFFNARFVPGGLYMLDEPEAALSPLRQLSLLRLIREKIEQDAQFIIATHSPILLAVPGATILNFDVSPPAPIAWDETEHVRLTRDFLTRPHAFLKHL